MNMPSKILIISDSRGKHLEPLLKVEASANTEYTVQVIPGATLSNIQRRLQRGTRRNTWDHILVIAGICDLTTRQKNGKNVNINYESRKTEEVCTLIDQLIQTAGNISISTIPPASITKYSTNREETPDSQTEQRNLEEDVKTINEHIISKSTELARPVFNLAKISELRSLKKQGNKRKRIVKFNFNDLHDGLHPSDTLLEKWATFINKVVKRTQNEDSSTEESEVETWNFKRQHKNQ